MIIYTRRCLCRQQERAKLRELRKLGKPIEFRSIHQNKDWKQEADSYGLTMPFVVEDGVAKPL